MTYLLTQKSLTPMEANCHALDLMMGAVETVSKTCKSLKKLIKIGRNNTKYVGTKEITLRTKVVVGHS